MQHEHKTELFKGLFLKTDCKVKTHRITFRFVSLSHPGFEISACTTRLFTVKLRHVLASVRHS